MVVMSPCAATVVEQTAEHHTISSPDCSEGAVSDVMANQEVGEADLTQWESGAEFSVINRGSGLTGSASPISVTPVASVSRFQCLADDDSETDTESVPRIDRRTRRR